jgi:3-methyladenine DNA glycosylase Tag
LTPTVGISSADGPSSTAGKLRARFLRLRPNPRLSKDLKHRGFSFVGPTVAYAYMQAVGMVNDHLVDCYRYREILQEVANAN